MTHKKPPFLSIIIPCFNEESNITNTYTELKNTFENRIDSYEIIFVENGSSDQSFSLIKDIVQKDPNVRYVQLTRNFGYQGGIFAGLERAQGEWITVLDCDLQDPPELILEMLTVAEASKGENKKYEVVYGIRSKRAENLFWRTAYKWFYRLWRFLAEIEVPLDASEFCVMHADVLKALKNLPEKQRFNRGLRAWVGFRQTGISYHRRARKLGVTKFSVLKAMELAFDGIFAYSVLPLRLILISGVLVTAFASLLSFLNVMFWILHQFGVIESVGVLPQGLTQLNLILTVLIGFIIISLGILGEYIGRIYAEVKARPSYLIQSETIKETKNEK